MARMIPPYCSTDTRSRGEKEIFKRFQTDPATDNWIVLHSLNLSEHITQLYGEIDFLVLAPSLGIFCLEVKAGNVQREDGIWKYSTLRGVRRTTTCTRGPFVQAQNAMFSLLENIRKEFGKNHRLTRMLFAYGVMFPHIEYKSPGPDEDWWKIYDRNSRGKPISQYIKRLSKYKQQKVQDFSWFDRKQSLPTVGDIEKLLKFLRGDFEKIVNLAKFSDDNTEELNSFTEEQFQVLDQLEYNERCLFEGAAGTGKTVLAIESALRNVNKKKSTLFLCFNALLAESVKERFKDIESDFLNVGTFHSFMLKVASKAGFNFDVEHSKQDSDFWNYELPLMVIEAVDSGIIEPFETLIIDEAQDLISENNLDVFDVLLEGGITGGQWQLFCDFERQAIYSELNSSTQLIDMLQSRANFVRFRLTINCRNTRPIGEETALLSGFEKPPFLPSKVEGLPVIFHFYKNDNDQLEQIQNKLDELKSQNVPADYISLLAPSVYEDSVASQLNQDKYKILKLSKNNFNNRKNNIIFSTIHGYKGLENSYVILTDIKQLDEKMKSILYVGMSRARTQLYLFISAKEKKKYQAILKKQIEIS